MKLLTFLTAYLLLSSLSAQSTISEKGIEASWEHIGDSIQFELTYQATGWVAIGFNESSRLSNTYLVMCRVRKEGPEVNEHYVLQAGEYQSITDLGEKQGGRIVDYKEDLKSTYIKFIIPIKAKTKYQKTLAKGLKYSILVAYSRSDDFQHHSIFRKHKTIIF